MLSSIRFFCLMISSSICPMFCWICTIASSMVLEEGRSAGLILLYILIKHLHVSIWSVRCGCFQAVMVIILVFILLFLDLIRLFIYIDSLNRLFIVVSRRWCRCLIKKGIGFLC
jgi:hypothetical protein